MERQLKRMDKEYMKMAMLKQEETFRVQVHELHRLYRVQKLLMRNAKNAEMTTEWSSHAQPNCVTGNSETERTSCQPCPNYLDQRRPADVFNAKSIGVIMQEADEESDLELTLATGSSRSLQKAKEASFTSDSGSSFSSSSTESGAVKLSSNQRGLTQMPDLSLRFRNEMKSRYDIEERTREDGLKQPPWLFQCLSLKMT